MYVIKRRNGTTLHYLNYLFGYISIENRGVCIKRRKDQSK